MARIVVDPITRIEGHLRIEADVTDGKIVDAFSSGTMIRGIEVILKGRDPRDAWFFAGRICNVCTAVHSLASVRSVENALDIKVPPNAELIRGLMYCAQYLQDHVVHFYHLHALDWVDVVSSLKADPQKISEIAKGISTWPKTSKAYFSDVLKRLKAFVESGQLGIFANGYWGHKLYKLPPEVNLLAVAHYLEALDWQRSIVKVLTIFGGKSPIANFLVGGMPCALDPEDPNAINIDRLTQIGSLFDEAIEFVEKVLVPDVVAIGSFYPDWGKIGGGLNNFMCFGDLPRTGIDQPETFRFPRGMVRDGNLSEVHPIDFGKITEDISHAWYDNTETAAHPFEGETRLNYTGPKPPYKHLDTRSKYSWIKAPRYGGMAVEVGPLARMLVGYASGNTEIQGLVSEYLGRLKLPKKALFSTLGRTLARGIETLLIAKWSKMILSELITNIRNGDLRTVNKQKWQPSTWPKEAKGIGLVEAPRGALSHFVVIKNAVIDNYQCVVPSTWNASPRDQTGQLGAYEAALSGTPMVDPKQPLEILRTVHSFDPCMACAVHLYDAKREQVSQIKIDV